MSEQTIEIDCPPGEPRPDHFMQTICGMAGVEYKEPVGKFFGNWTWAFNEMEESEWKKLSNIARTVITDAYNRGAVRYGSW